MIMKEYSSFIAVLPVNHMSGQLIIQPQTSVL
jgi:hypothetical protein